MTIQEISQQIIDEFANFDEWLDRYAYLIDLGKECPVIDEKDKTEENLIRALDGQTRQDILDADLAFIDAIGLKEHLSPTRSNGLTSMVKQMKMYALAYKMKQ